MVLRFISRWSFFVAIYLVFSTSISAQRKFESAVFEPIVCYGTGINNHVRIGPPSEYLSRLKGANAATANIIVDYSGFTPRAKAAFQKAVDIWASLIYSPVPIYVQAVWAKKEEGILGSCGPSVYYRNFDGAASPDVFYPVALAEKMNGHDLNNAGAPDMVATFNSAVKTWYYGTDGETPNGMYDLVSTVLHELCHGLGFVGSMGITSDRLRLGYWGGLSLPPVAIAFDYFIENKQGQVITNLNIFTNPSKELYSQYTSRALYFNGPVLFSENGGKTARLYAPSAFNEGSSIYHLDDATYDNTINDLMTHAAGTAESTHNPGPITMSIMQDMGWVTTRIDYDTLKDQEDVINPELLVKITSDKGFKENTAILHYSYDSFATENKTPLIYDNKPGRYKVNVPVPGANKTIYYYVGVNDNYNRVFRFPNHTNRPYFSFYVGTDTVPAYLKHQSIPFILTTTDSIGIKANAGDNIGIQSVVVEYSINGSAKPDIQMSNDTLDIYKAYFVFNGSIKQGDTLRYRIIATDASNAGNKTMLPREGYFKVPIEDVMPSLDEYQNNFENAGNDFYLTGFDIFKVDGITSVALQTDHPYFSPGLENQSFEYFAQLKYPVKIREDYPYILFKEIALVEPGEDKTEYGNENFFDYCVVEGSKDGGNTWNAFEPGYDCRAHKEWEEAYNSVLDFSGNNSAAIPTSGFFKKRIIDMKYSNNGFATGDEVLIRFRLYSDPFGNGWGWAIDDLRIQGDVTSADENSLHGKGFEIYPNPTNGQFVINLENRKEPTTHLQIKVCDVMGRTIWNETYVNGEIKIPVNLGNVPKGIYLVQLFDGENTITKKISKY